MINLLIVDDDAATVEVIKDSVNWKKLNIDNVYTELNVLRAKRILLNHNIDIIISDIEMPQETGLDFLKWVREKEFTCEFLFLTCHENFSYATNALNYEASAYLTKPFDINAMEFNIQKIIKRLEQKRNLKKASEYGLWMKKNTRFMKLNFWEDVLDGELSNEQIKKELSNKHLSIKFDDKFILVYTKISNTGADIECYEKSIFEFILEDFHSEILTDKVENESVIKYHDGDELSFITICSSVNCDGIKAKCEDLIKTCKKYFKSAITCCISNVYVIAEVSKEKYKLKELTDYNVKCFGKAFFENEVDKPNQKGLQIIDLPKVSDLLKQKDKVQILCYLKQLFDELSAYDKLNQHSLYLMQQEIIQVVYADLMEKGIDAAKLFYDDLSIKMSNHATDSIVDTVRWVNYVIEKTFDYEGQIAKSATIINKINTYIHEHYFEDIGRKQIAEKFYLTPDYLAKLYKKKTGVNLKDYINGYRIEKAKKFLESGEKSVSEVAAAVGFDSHSYFSTLFKRQTGVSPKDYKDKM